MKYLKKFNESLETPFITDPTEVRALLHDYYPDSRKFSIRPDGTVDVGGDLFEFFPAEMTQLPIKFGSIMGDFHLYGKHLSTLEGCPDECGDFNFMGASVNEILEDLTGGPRVVRGIYNLTGSHIKSLKGAPEIVGGLYLDSSDITSLEGCPEMVDSILLNHTSIRDLVGGPKRVREYKCVGMKELTSLEGFPEQVVDFELKSEDGRCNLEGGSLALWDPRPMKGCSVEVFKVGTNDPKLLELVDMFHDMMMNYCALAPYQRDIAKRTTRKFIESLDYNYIRGDRFNPQINLFRLKEAFSELGIKTLRSRHHKKDRLQNYQFVDEEGRVVNFHGDPL